MMAAMIFCTGCGKQIHETAPFCPHCGKPQATAVPVHPAHAGVNADPLWAAITSLVLGVLCALAGFDDADSAWHDETIIGLALFSVVGFVMGIVSLNISKRGKSMAIAGMVMSGLGILLCIGEAFEGG